MFVSRRITCLDFMPGGSVVLSSLALTCGLSQKLTMSSKTTAGIGATASSNEVL